MTLIALALAAALQSAPIDCSDADHSAFDFWIGDWIVSTTNGGVDVATSTIAATALGCGIKENFVQTVGPGGVATDYRGHSYSAFDAADGLWKQFYLDSSGWVTLLVGSASDGAMVLESGRDLSRQRMTVRPQANGTVRQSGESSADGGQTWTAGYDFTYRPAER